jgi:hypothetical protein
MPQTISPSQEDFREQQYREQPFTQDNRSIAGLFSDLWRETLTLFREEAELAKVEISEKVSEVKSGVVELAAGALVLYAGFLVLLAAASMGLAKLLPPEHAGWLAPLIVGVVVMIAGAVLLAKGRGNLKAGNLTPERTMHELRRDAELAKEHAR